MSWLTHVRNKEQIRGLFGDSPPPLASVWLLGLLFRPASPPGCYFAVELQQLPENAPVKWRHEGYDRVRLNCFADISGSVHMSGVASASRVRVEFRDGLLLLVAVDHSWSFEAQVFGVDARPVGFRARDYEQGGPEWCKPSL